MKLAIVESSVFDSTIFISPVLFPGVLFPRDVKFKTDCFAFEELSFSSLDIISLLRTYYFLSSFELCIPISIIFMMIIGMHNS